MPKDIVKNVIAGAAWRFFNLLITKPTQNLKAHSKPSRCVETCIFLFSLLKVIMNAAEILNFI